MDGLKRNETIQADTNEAIQARYRDNSIVHLFCVHPTVTVLCYTSVVICEMSSPTGL